MTPFTTQLRALSAAATPGPWMMHKDPKLPNFLGEWTIRRIPHTGLSKNGTFFVAHIVSMLDDNHADAQLVITLRNRADAIAEAVEAASRVAGTHRHCFDGGTDNYGEHGCPCEICDLERAIARLNGEVA